MEPPLPRLLRDDTPEVNLDYAASTPVLAAVWEAVEAFVPWYSSVHRGSRREVAGRDRGVRGRARRRGASSSAPAPATTSSSCATRPRRSTSSPQRCRRARGCSSSPVEHHANMLPWRRHDLRLLPFTGSPDELLDAAERALRGAPRIDLVAVTGASNVTGEVWPLAELAALAHRARRRAVRRRRAARAAPADRHGARPGSTSSRSPATSSTRRSAPARWSAPRARRPASRCCTAAARSSSSRSTTSSGPTRPSATRPARRT